METNHIQFLLAAERPPVEPTYVDPCVPTPCGQNSECRDVNGQASCACLATFIGSPPNCRPECVINPDCPSNEACLQSKCRDPCPGSCGISAECSVVNHTPMCTCPEGYMGDPFTRCLPKLDTRKTLYMRNKSGFSIDFYNCNAKDIIPNSYGSVLIWLSFQRKNRNLSIHAPDVERIRNVSMANVHVCQISKAIQ